MRCNICGGSSFTDMPKRPNARCATCGSLERTRVVALYLAKYVKPKPATRILHFAPERGLSNMLREISGANYRALDLNPGCYPGLGVEPFDLCRDIFDLPEESADLIIHNHVLEHVECNYTAVLIRLAKTLSPSGTMLFSMPILPGHFSDELIRLPHPDKIDRFGELLHVRRFGVDFLQETIGMIFHVPPSYDLLQSFDEAELIEANIPARHWRNFTGASVFRMTRSDLR